MVKASTAIYGLLLVAAACLALVFAHRSLRIEAYSMCGVGMPSCEAPLQCINGYCKSTKTPYIPKQTDLPVI